MSEINNMINKDLIPDYVPAEVVDDLRNHLYYVFKYMGYGEPTPIQYGIAEALMNGNNDMILQAGRGTGKSVITSVLASWWLLRDPNATILVVSATAQKSVDFISMTRNTINVVPYLQHLVPNDGDTDNAFMFNVGSKSRVTQDKSLTAAGITTQIVGKHAEYIIGDDIEVRGNCDTAEQREKLMGRIHEFESIRNKGGRVVFLGTPHTRDSNYNQLKTQGYPVFKFPALYPDSSVGSLMEDVADWVFERQRDQDAADNSPTQPERFDMDMLNDRLARIGPANFALQFRLDTSLSDEQRYTIKLEDLVVMDVGDTMGPRKVVHAKSEAYKNIPSFGLAGDMCYKPMYIDDKFEDYAQTVMTIDPSGRGSDETGVVIASFLNGYIYIHEMIGLDGGYDEETLTEIAKLAHRYSVKLVRYEENFGDGMFGNLLQPVLGRICGAVGTEGFKVNGQKEVRIMDTLEPVISQHKLVMDTRAIRQEANQVQLTRITRDRGALKHDDRIDCLSSAVGYFVDSMSLDVDKVIEKNLAKEKEDLIKMFADDDRRSQFIIENHTSGAARIHEVHKKKTGNGYNQRTIFQQQNGQPRGWGGPRKGSQQWPSHR